MGDRRRWWRLHPRAGHPTLKSDKWRAVSGEIRSGLPGHHEHTHLPQPQDSDLHDTVSTGELQHGRPLRVTHLALGLSSWAAWFGIGLYAWWFTDSSPIDFVIGTIGWLAIFAFAFVGIPIVRVLASNRNPQ